GTFNPVGQIMRRMCREYRMVLRMIEGRGTAEFGRISQELYGSASDAFHAGDPTITDLGIMLTESLSNIGNDLGCEPKTIAGSAEFVRTSQTRHASASAPLHAGDPTIPNLGFMLTESLSSIGNDLGREPKTIAAPEAVAILQEQMDKVFPDDQTVRVFESDGIVADAAAGADYIKIRSDAMFNQRDLKIRAVHEGMVHVATRLNGQHQPTWTFLAKGPP